MKRLLLVIMILPLLATVGCWHRKGSTKVRETSAVATDVEEGFKLRWMDKRVGELVAQGQSGEAARRQATDEFNARYTYLVTGK